MENRLGQNLDRLKSLIIQTRINAEALMVCECSREEIIKAYPDTKDLFGALVESTVELATEAERYATLFPAPEALDKEA